MVFAFENFKRGAINKIKVYNFFAIIHNYNSDQLICVINSELCYV